MGISIRASNSGTKDTEELNDNLYTDSHASFSHKIKPLFNENGLRGPLNETSWEDISKNTSVM